MTDENEATPEQAEVPAPGGGQPRDTVAGVRADGGERPVTDLDGIGETYGESLADAGVETAVGLLSTETAEIADATGIPESRIEQWKATARDVVPDERLPDDSGDEPEASDEDELSGASAETEVGDEEPVEAEAEDEEAMEAEAEDEEAMEAEAEDEEAMEAETEDEEAMEAETEDEEAMEAETEDEEPVEAEAEDEEAMEAEAEDEEAMEAEAEDEQSDAVPEGEDMFGTAGSDESDEDAGEEPAAEPDATDDSGKAPGEADATEATGEETAAESGPSEPADVTDAGEVTGGETTSGGGSETVTQTETSSSGAPERSEEELEEEILEPEERMGPNKKFCTNCGEAIDQTAEICPECGVRQEDTGPSGGSGGDTDEQDPAIAGLLSFLIPGAGQMLNGATTIGAVLLVGWIVWLVVGWFILVPALGFILGVITFFVGGIGGLLAPVIAFLIEVAIHVGAGYHAYDQAQKINAGTISVD